MEIQKGRSQRKRNTDERRTQWRKSTPLEVAGCKKGDVQHDGGIGGAEQRTLGKSVPDPGISYTPMGVRKRETVP